MNILYAVGAVIMLGNFWVDLTRATLYVLLPLAIVLALAPVSQGVVQTLAPMHAVALVQPVAGADGGTVTVQHIAVGPAASQVAIKQLGTNGGGFFNTNSAHPLENPTPLSNFLVLQSRLPTPQQGRRGTLSEICQSLRPCCPA